MFNIIRNWNSFQECVYYFSLPSANYVSFSCFICSSTFSVVFFFSIPVALIFHFPHNSRHIFMYITVTCVSSFLKYLFKSFCYFQILLSFEYWCVGFLYIFRMQALCQEYFEYVILVCSVLFYFFNSLLMRFFFILKES